MFRSRGGVSLTVTLAVSISMLVFIAVITVLGIGLWSGLRNTVVLLRDKAEIAVTTISDKVRDHLAPAESQLTFISRLIASGQLDPQDRTRLVATLTGALAGAPQISALLFVNSKLETLIAGRAPEGVRIFERDDAGDATMMQAFEEARTAKRPKWGEPLWRDLPKETMLNLRLGVRRQDELIGVLIAAVSVRRLSAYLGRLDPVQGGNVFVLYGRDRVLAHPNLVSNVYKRSVEAPLLRLGDVGDPVLAAIWQRDDRYPLRLVDGTKLNGHVLQVFGDEYIYIYRDIDGYGDRKWQIGTYFRSADVESELRRLRSAALAGFAMLLAALVTAILLARQIAKPIVDLAKAASHIGQLEISETTPLPGSVFRELNDQARSFNAMLAGLKWFEAYVPKQLVRRLIRQSGDSMPASEEREVTVMFTDIAGFTSLAEGRPAEDIAGFLNHHFTLLAKCVEDTGGTLDKFVGDSVMAFWGAPDSQPDHARRALTTAAAISQALSHDNKEREACGKQPVRIRIGVHSGRVTVGNIGAPGRINYTIIGDTVNVGQRLEQLAKNFVDTEGRSSQATILVSQATARAVGREPALQPLGAHQLRGRNDPTKVYRFITHLENTATDHA